MTAPSSPVTLVYGSEKYDEVARHALQWVAWWSGSGLAPDTVPSHDTMARALLAADERARANEAKYLAEVAAHGRSSQTLTYNVELRIAAEARAEAAEAEAKSAHEDWEIVAGQCRVAEARCAESFRAGIEAAARIAISSDFRESDLSLRHSIERAIRALTRDEDFDPARDPCNRPENIR